MYVCICLPACLSVCMYGRLGGMPWFCKSI